MKAKNKINLSFLIIIIVSVITIFSVEGLKKVEASTIINSKVLKKKNMITCKDTRALNFSPYGQHDERVCYYPWGWGGEIMKKNIMTKEELRNKLCQSNVILIQKLKKGDRDGEFSEYEQEIVMEVAILQKYLRELGLYSGFIDGIYGESTKTAVSSMQRLLGLEDTGEINDETINAVFSSCD